MLGRDLLTWKSLVGYPSNAQAYRALGITNKTWDRLTRGDRRDVPIPRTIGLAAAAIAAGLDTWKPPDT